MKRIIVRADDLGYSEAVNLGIAKTVKDGIIGSVGVMPNMPTAKMGLALLDGTGVCLGQHTNVCLGKPCADPKLIPSLVDEQGNLKSSRTYREAFAKGEEFASLDEMVIEIEAQYQRFVELVGHDPSYFEGHAVMSWNLDKALGIVAERHGLRYNRVVLPSMECTFDGKPMSICAAGCMLPFEQYDAREWFRRGVSEAREDMPNTYVCHPGYVDAYLLSHSSLTLNRAKEVEMATDPQIRAWVESQGDVQLITYDEA